ncbi:uncharacterized protein LOC130636567 [Hydractinia symbiolongicarpus]|uniref:uncharacterized protein LOC130636567 n=1 Tax=Hydractinia symbiolongicarpus TaxID=13093 RepID=UPI002551B0B0|nr:uncharacterized protein LOC130636567 [Hydractinia symbiolongicarpus]
MSELLVLKGPDIDCSIAFSMAATPCPLPDVMEPLADVTCNLDMYDGGNIFLSNISPSNLNNSCSKSSREEIKTEFQDNMDLNNNVTAVNNIGNCSVNTATVVSNEGKPELPKQGPRVKFTTGQNMNIFLPPLVPASMLLQKESFECSTYEIIKKEPHDTAIGMICNNFKEERFSNSHNKLLANNSTTESVVERNEEGSNNKTESNNDDGDRMVTGSCLFVKKDDVSQQVAGPPDTTYVDLVTTDEAEENNTGGAGCVNKIKNSTSDKYRYKIDPKIVTKLKNQRRYDKLRKMTCRRRRCFEEGDSIASRINTSSKRKTRVEKYFVDSESSDYELISDNMDHHIDVCTSLNEFDKTSCDVEINKTIPEKRRRKIILNLEDFLSDTDNANVAKENDPIKTKFIQHCQKGKKSKKSEIDLSKTERSFPSSVVCRDLNTISIDERFKHHMKSWNKKQRRREREKEKKQKGSPLGCEINGNLEIKVTPNIESEEKTSNASSRVTFSMECFKLGDKSSKSASSIAVRMKKGNMKSYNRRVYTQSIKDEDACANLLSRNLQSKITDNYGSYVAFDNSLRNNVGNSERFRKTNSMKKTSGSIKKRTSSAECLMKAKRRGSYALEKMNFL